MCVSEDVTGQFGLCGYFQEYDQDLAPEDRLRCPGATAPFDLRPALASASRVNAERLEKAQRNYALEYLVTACLPCEGLGGSEQGRLQAGRN